MEFVLVDSGFDYWVGLWQCAWALGILGFEGGLSLGKVKIPRNRPRWKAAVLYDCGTSTPVAFPAVLQRRSLLYKSHPLVSMRMPHWCYRNTRETLLPDLVNSTC